MIVSALLTSVGINTALCVLFFTLYSVLRKQPSNNEVYVPRLLAEEGSSRRRRSHFNLERLVPSTGWVVKAWKLSEDEILSLLGLDGLVFMRLITFSLKVFTFAGIIGIFVLLPVNCSGDALEGVDFANVTSSSLDVFTISNVKDGSFWLWFHFSAVYLVTGFICFMLYQEYDYISSRRISYFYSSPPQLHQFTIVVRSIPASSSCSISESVESFFKELYPTEYLSHVVVRRTRKIINLLNEAEKLGKKLSHLQSDPSQQKHRRGGLFGIFGHKTNLKDHYGKKLEDIEENVRLKQSEALLAGQETGAAFVSFKSRFAAATAFHVHPAVNPIEWITEQAPEPVDVYWPSFSESFMRRWISKFVVILVVIVFTILFLIPVVFVQGLTNLSELETLFPFLKSILTISFVSQVITGYLPSLILQLFLKTVPPVMEFLSSIQGFISRSNIEKSACRKVLWFTIWNAFFATVFSGSALNQLSIFLDPKSIPQKLAVAVPAQASFFIAYVVTSGWTSTSSELFRIIPLISSLIRRPFISDDDEFEIPSFPYFKDIPRVLLFGLLGITYFFLAPLILPFLIIYLCLAYIVFRNQFINVYAPKYDTAGKFWPIVHTSMIFSLVLMHIIAAGIFALKELSIASTLMVPLPIITLLFNAYCRKRFLPMFVAYSAESLVKKDREDPNDAAMDEFYDKLVIAYKDPALQPIESLSNTSTLRTPLMSP